MAKGETEKIYLNLSRNHDDVTAYKRDGKYFICISDEDCHWKEKEISKSFFNAVQEEFKIIINK